MLPGSLNKHPQQSVLSEVTCKAYTCTNRQHQEQSPSPQTVKSCTSEIAKAGEKAIPVPGLATPAAVCLQTEAMPQDAIFLWRGGDDIWCSGTLAWTRGFCRNPLHARNAFCNHASAFLFAPYCDVLQVSQGSLCVRYLKTASPYSSVLPAIGDMPLMWHIPTAHMSAFYILKKPKVHFFFLSTAAYAWWASCQGDTIFSSLPCK